MGSIKMQKKKKWIENIDVPEWYYEKWNWEDVFSVKDE